jgi:hypothetical protein
MPVAEQAWLLLASLQVEDNALGPAASSLQTFMGLQRQVGGRPGFKDMRAHICVPAWLTAWLT